VDIVIRVDASRIIGGGHVMRCISLANKLKLNGATVTFITRSNNNLIESIQSNGHRLEVIAESSLDKNLSFEHDIYKTWKNEMWEYDALKCNKIINNISPQWTIVDHYGLDYKWHRTIRNATKNIMVIDDIADRKLDCDLLLDQTFLCKYSKYKNLIPKECKVLLGSKYTLLRDEFRYLRGLAIKKRKKYNGIKKILISFGSMDFENNSEKILSILNQIKWKYNISVDIVFDKNSHNYTNLKQYAKLSSLPVKILSNVKNMSELMLKADIAIGAAGTTTWERCCLGLPSLVLNTASNQRYVVSSLKKNKVIFNIKPPIRSKYSGIEDAIEILQNDKNIYTNMSKSSFAICDGLGSERVASSMLNY